MSSAGAGRRALVALVAPAASAQDVARPVAPGALMVTPLDVGSASGRTAAFVLTGDDAVHLGDAAHCAGDGVMGPSGYEEATSARSGWWWHPTVHRVASFPWRSC